MVVKIVIKANPSYQCQKVSLIAKMELMLVLLLKDNLSPNAGILLLFLMIMMLMEVMVVAQHFALHHLSPKLYHQEQDYYHKSPYLN